MKQVQLAGDFEKPTVGDFVKMANLAASNKSVDLFELHTLLGIGGRSFRNWIAKSDVNPEAKSSVPFWAFNIVHAMANGKPYVKPLSVDWKSRIDSQLIMTAEQYQCPIADVLTDFVGKKSITGLTRQELAKRVGADSNWLSIQIREAKITFGTYANILLLCGVPEYMIFPTNESSDLSFIEPKRETDVIADTYMYNESLTIRTSDKIERYPQKTGDGNEIVVVYVDEVEFKGAGSKWSKQGFRWAIVEPHLTEEEIKNWLLNNGLSTVPFLRG